MEKVVHVNEEREKILPKMKGTAIDIYVKSHIRKVCVHSCSPVHSFL